LLISSRERALLSDIETLTASAKINAAHNISAEKAKKKEKERKGNMSA